MKKNLILILLLSNLAFAYTDYIKIKDNDITYEFKSSCKQNGTYYKPSRDQNRYEIILKSKDNIFKNYKIFNRDETNYLVTFITDLYTVEPTWLYADNKSTIHAFLSEKDFKNIFDLNNASYISVEFDDTLLIDENNYNMYAQYRKDYVKPYCFLFHKYMKYDDIIDECNRDYNKSLLVYTQKKKEKENKELLLIVGALLGGIILFVIVIIVLKKFIKKYKDTVITKMGKVKKVKDTVITKIDKLKKEKRSNEIKTLIEDETIKETIKKSFDFSDKSNIKELQIAISEALKKDDIVEAQKLMDILKKITDSKKL